MSLPPGPKVVLTVAVLTLLTAVVGCGEDPEIRRGEDIQGRIVGVWKVNFKEMRSPDNLGGVSYEFSAVGGFAMVEGGRRMEGSYQVKSVSEDRLTISATLRGKTHEAVLVPEGADRLKMWHVDHSDTVIVLDRSTPK